MWITHPINGWINAHDPLIDCAFNSHGESWGGSCSHGLPCAWTLRSMSGWFAHSSANNDLMHRHVFAQGCTWLHESPCASTVSVMCARAGGDADVGKVGVEWPAHGAGHASHGSSKRVYKGNWWITWWIMGRFNDFNGFYKLIHRQFNARINDSLLPLPYILHWFTHSFEKTWWVTGVIKELIRINGLYCSPSEPMLHSLNGWITRWINGFIGESMSQWS